MQETELQFQLQGHEIYGFCVEPELVNGAVVLVHGFGEHSGRYREAVIPMLLEAGLAVMAYDNIGHGKSSGKRGHCPSYHALLEVLHEVVVHVKTQFPKAPIMLYAHSMGGNLALNYALRNSADLEAIVATSPYLRLAFQPPKWKVLLGKLMLKLIPSITLPSGLDPNGISRIPSEVKKYQNDPLIFDAVSPMYSFPIIDAGEWAIANASSLSIPSLLLHGTADPIIDFKGTLEFHNNTTSTSLKLFDGGYHELHYDKCAAEMLAHIKNWISQRLV